jgi:hypothetical protein
LQAECIFTGLLKGRYQSEFSTRNYKNRVNSLAKILWHYADNTQTKQNDQVFHQLFPGPFTIYLVDLFYLPAASAATRLRKIMATYS